MKRAFLYAYDRQNLGDDLFVHTITKRYPHVKFYMWTDLKNRETYRSLPNVKVVNRASKPVLFLQRLRPSWVGRYRAWLQKRCQAVIYISGSIFMEAENWEQVLTWWDYEVKEFPFYVMGVNFGPWKTEEYRSSMAKIFSKMKDICFRDTYSWRLFEDVPTARCAPDILFSYPMPQETVREKQIFVSCINSFGRDQIYGLSDCGQRYVKNMAAMLKRYLDDGYELVFGSFCEEEGDERAIRRILEEMGCCDHPGVRSVLYNGTNADELTRAMAQSEFVIATRFHGIVLSMVAGRPVLPLIYSDKTLRVLEDLGYDGPLIDIRSCEDYTCVGQPRVFAMDREKLAQEAQKHFEKLDAVL